MNHDISTDLPTRYVPPEYFSNWLEAGVGRAAYFSRIDPGLFPSLISKFKSGDLAITFEYAVRLERAQKASPNPLKAEQLMTFTDHREYLRYITGQQAAPAQLPKPPRKRRTPHTEPIAA